MTGEVAQGQLRVLVVDDDLSVQNLLSEMLKRMGFMPLVADSGAQALELVSQSEVHLVLLDARMPGMSGMDVFTELRATNNNVPVVFASGHVDSDIEALHAQHPESTGILAKPFTMQALHDTLQQLLNT